MRKRLSTFVLAAALGLGACEAISGPDHHASRGGAPATPESPLAALRLLDPAAEGDTGRGPEGPVNWRRTWGTARRLLDLHPPTWVERWLYNPRERTVRGLELLDAAGPAEALEPFETARRIAPDEPEVLFNVGTARLLAESGGAVPLLERAVGPTAGAEDEDPGGSRRPPPGLLQPAWYNLGAARLAADDPAGAARAFEEALRLAPEDRNAKHNLEVALRRLEERRRLRTLPPRELPEGQRPGQEEESESAGGTEPEPREEPDRRAGRDPSGGEESAGREPGEGPAPDRRVLPQFQEQEDLTAAEAAALLESVETLERLQRHLQATRAARRAGAEEEDW